MRVFRLEAMVRMDRNAALAAAVEAIGGSGGWVVDHSLLSDLMAVVNFEIPADRTADLVRLLRQVGIPVAPPTPGEGPPGADLMGQLTLTFPLGSGDLRRDVPAFS